MPISPFVRGHAQAKGGSVAVEVFDQILRAMGFEDGGAPNKKGEMASNPKGTLEAFETNVGHD